MTIPTSTSSPFPDGAPALGGGLLPLDPGEMQRMADSLFRSLPGAPSLAGIAAWAPGGASTPALAAALAGPASAVAPSIPAALPLAGVPQPSAASPAGIAPSFATLSPHGAAPAGAVPSAPGASAAGPAVPAPYAAALPSIGTPSAPSAAPFYFLGAGQGSSSDDFLDSLAAEGLGRPATAGGERVGARSYDLPGQEGVTGAVRPDAGLGNPLVTGHPGESSRSAPGGPGSASAASSAPAYFSFLEGNPSVADPRVGRPVLGQPFGALLDVQAVRRDFPILQERVNGKPLIWFDNAATTQKPRSVIDRISHFYAHENSNIHRAAHELAARSTDAYEGARSKVARFLGAKGPEEIIFVRGATEAINLVARTWGRQEIGEGDEIVLSQLEHHANIVPWQQLAEMKKAKIKVIPVDDDGQIRLDEYARLLGPRVKIVSVTQVSNALGTVTPIREIIALAHAHGAKVVVDGAQAVSHMRVDVQALDADFYVFSGHKVFAPTGIGVVYGKKALLDAMPPWQGGGNMIADVTFERTVFQGAPARFEAGTGSIADAVGLGAAIDYVQQLGLERIGQYEHALLEYATERLRPIPGVRLVGTAREKASVLSFVLAGYKTEEVGAALNREGIAVRSGHHCAQPILRRFGLEATVRPSLAFYNTCEEVDTFIAVIRGLARRK